MFSMYDYALICFFAQVVGRLPRFPCQPDVIAEKRKEKKQNHTQILSANLHTTEVELLEQRFNVLT